MIYKAIGGLLILSAGGYLSLSVSRFERRRPMVLDAYMALLYYIKGQIECYALPVADIIARADPTIILACLGRDEPRDGDVSAVIPALLSTGEPVMALVQESRLYLEPECERLLLTFAGELGHTYRADQVTRCEHYITALAEERRRLIEALPTRVRVSSTLCLSCALGAAILLW